jgi:hypothetical protein
MLLEVAYRLHATKAVRRERDDRRRGGNTLSS